MNVFREAVSAWERLANEYGGQMLARPETAQAMQGATSAGLQIQGAVQDAMSKVLGAANMPSKAEIDGIGQRLAAIEAALVRIEARLPPAPPSTTRRPARTRKPATP